MNLFPHKTNMKKKTTHTLKHCRKILRGRLTLCLLYHKEALKGNYPGKRTQAEADKEIKTTYETLLTLSREYGIITHKEENKLHNWITNWTKDTQPLTNIATI